MSGYIGQRHGFVRAVDLVIAPMRRQIRHSWIQRSGVTVEALDRRWLLSTADVSRSGSFTAAESSKSWHSQIHVAPESPADVGAGKAATTYDEHAYYTALNVIGPSSGNRPASCSDYYGSSYPGGSGGSSGGPVTPDGNSPTTGSNPAETTSGDPNADGDSADNADGDDSDDDPEDCDTIDDESGDPVQFFNGQPRVDSVDLLSAGFGKTWGQVRSFSDKASSTSYVKGLVGNRWVLMNQPQLQQDTVKLGTILAFTSGSNQLVFDPQSGGEYTERFNQGNRLKYDPQTNLFSLMDGTGGRSIFYDFASSVPVLQQGKLKEYIDRGGNVTTLDYAVSNDSSGLAAGLLKTVTRSDGAGSVERWLYSYGTGSYSDLIAKVELKRGTSLSSLVTVRQVVYAYYTTGASYGNDRDLKSATVQTAAGATIDVYQYRYYTSADAGTSGYVGGLKYVFGPKASAEAAASPAVNLTTASDIAVKAYADNYFEYDSAHRVTKEVVRGAGCSCTGSTGQGEYQYSYTTRSTVPTSINGWYYKTVQTKPDGNTNTYYANTVGQMLLQVFKSGTQQWGTFQQYELGGHMSLLARPSAVIIPASLSTLENYDDLLHNQSGNYEYLKDNDGLISRYDYYGTTTATVGTTTSSASAGGVAGFFKSAAVQQGDTGTVIPRKLQKYIVHVVDRSATYSSTYGDDYTYPVAEKTIYNNVDGTDAQTTRYEYDWFANSSAISSKTVILPAIASYHHGSNANLSVTTIFDTYGRPVWTRDTGGIINYVEYDNGTGAIKKSIVDVNTATITGIVSAVPTGWSTLTGAGLQLVTAALHDGIGRTTKVTDPNDNVTWTVYNDTSHEARVYRGWKSSNGTAPVSIKVHRDDYGRRYSEDLSMSTTPTTATVNGELVPTGAESISGIQSLVRSYKTAGEQLGDVHQYINLSGVTYSQNATLAGAAAGTKYLVTHYEYDPSGRLSRVVVPDGTITRTEYDGLNRVTQVQVGTRYQYPTTATNTNLQTVATYEYDNNGIGDSKVTKVTHDPDGMASSSGDFVETRKYDWRKRLTEVRGAGGIAVEYAYNNLGRRTQVKNYVDADADLTIDPGEQIGLSTTAYDELGRVYESSTYQGTRKLDAGALGVYSGTTAQVLLAGHGFSVGQSIVIEGAYQPEYNGTFTIISVTDDSFRFNFGGSMSPLAIGSRITVKATKRITTGYWYDPRGNLAKTQIASGLISKSFYDGAGHVVRTAISADPTEASSGTYADVLSLTGDQVIEQADYKRDAGGRIRIATTWQRDGSESSTITGPATLSHYDHSSAVYFYDTANRLTATMNYGRDGSEAAGTASVWTTVDGRDQYVDVKDVNDLDADNDREESDGVIDVLQVTPGLSNATSQTSYDWVYTGYAYDNADNLSIVTDNAGRQTHYGYDSAGRTVAMVENYGNGTASETETDTDRTTLYGYTDKNGKDWGRLETQTVKNPLGLGLGVQSQVTRFIYGSEVDRSWVTAKLYGDTDIPLTHITADSTGKETLTSSDTDAVYTNYDNLGRVTEETDQRGVKHTYLFDAAGRLASDSINGTSSTILGLDGRRHPHDYVWL